MDDLTITIRYQIYFYGLKITDSEQNPPGTRRVPSLPGCEVRTQQKLQEPAVQRHTGLMLRLSQQEDRHIHDEGLWQHGVFRRLLLAGRQAARAGHEAGLQEDTAAYQQAGNSIVVDVLIAILKQMDITKYGVAL